MTTTCANHPTVPASHTAKMPKATRPYREDVPLCGECALRVKAIGFAISVYPREGTQ